MIPLRFLAPFFLVFLLSSCATAGDSPPQAEELTQQKPEQQFGRVSNYEECVAAGFPSVRTFPPKCVDDLGQVYVLGRGEADSVECIDKCGDGICQQIVCQGTGCPCAESPGKCPQDCIANEFAIE